MFRVNSSGSTPDGRFKASPAPATQLDAAWFNALQDEIVNVITSPLAGDEALNPADSGQLLSAILRAVSLGLAIDVDEAAKTIAIGPFQIKWGSVIGSFSEGNVPVSFAPPFPSVCIMAVPLARNDSGGNTRDIWTQLIGAPTRFGFNCKLQLGGGGTSNSIDGFQWIAFGF